MARAAHHMEHLSEFNFVEWLSPRRLIGTLITVSAAVAVVLLVTNITELNSSQPTNTMASSNSESHRYYKSVMSRLGYSATPHNLSFSSIVGEANPPTWMTGQLLPSQMMGNDSDVGQAMGRLWQDAPGPFVSTTGAEQLGNQIPANATISPETNSIIFSSTDIHMTVVANASDTTSAFRIAGMNNPAITIPMGAHVSIEFINADPESAHGFAVTNDVSSSSLFPMMLQVPAFENSAIWFLGDASPTQLHSGMTDFTASVLGTYEYLCPIPGRAQEGFAGSLIVASQ